jgi:hypothetical protein
VLQEFSTLDRDKPGDPADYMRNVDRLAALFKARNPAVDIRLAATWTRADQTLQIRRSLVRQAGNGDGR